MQSSKIDFRALAGVFIYGKRQNEKERIEKARLNPERKQ